MEQIANPVFNDQLAGQLISGGYSYWAIFIVLLQLVIIPFTMFLWKLRANSIQETQKLQKEIIDRETQLRKQERDSEIKDINQRITAIEKDTRQMINGVIEAQNRSSDTLQRLFKKLDDLVNEVKEITIFMHVQKNKATEAKNAKDK